MEKLNGTPIAPPMTRQVQLPPNKVAVVHAGMRTQNILGHEAHLLAETFGEKEAAAFFQSLMQSIGRYLEEYVGAHSRRVIPASVIPNLEES